MRKPLLCAVIVPVLALASGCKDEKNTSETAAPPAASLLALRSLEGKPLDASCFSLLLSDEEHPPGEGAPVALKNCRREDLRPLSRAGNEPDLTDYDYAYTGDALSPSGTDESGTRTGGGADGHMRYKVLGRAGDDYIVQYAETSGEDGALGFESLLRVTMSDGRIALKSVPAAGGDRCAGGIRSAAVENGVPVYVLNLTPAGLLTLPIPGLAVDNTEVADSDDEPEGICTASVEKRNDAVTKVRLNVESPAARHAFADPLRSACFYKVFSETAARAPDGLDPNAFAQFRRTLAGQCKGGS